MKPNCFPHKTILEDIYGPNGILAKLDSLAQQLETQQKEIEKLKENQMLDHEYRQFRADLKKFKRNP